MTDNSICMGLKLELVPRKNAYRGGELPEFDAKMTNISFGSIIFCTYMATHRLMTGLFAGDYEVVPFGPTITPPLSESDFMELPPDGIFSVPLTFGSGSHYRFLYAGSAPPVVDENMALAGFPPGTYTFCVHLGPKLGCSIAEEGQYAFHMVIKEVPKDIERSPGLSVDFTKVWDGALTAKTAVTFM
ncbi:MAG: hypothetical protein RDV48_18025 [Candidatus Eremiobacteraeota bacterium]|nr:hypothetical protein [Candidatus Eremiobacteraeota bacterium]